MTLHDQTPGHEHKIHNLVGIAGDWHGNGNWGVNVLTRLYRKGVRKVIQVGDFGLWPGYGGIKYLDQLNEYARKYGITIYAVRGNHDWNEWERLLRDGTAPDLETGGEYVRSHIVLLPRTGSFKLGHTVTRRFFVAGGAVSIDKAWRVPGDSWWIEEELTDAEVDKIADYPAGAIDVLLTHDASNRTPWRNRLKPDLDSQIHRQRIDRVLAKTQPTMHFHGHFHEWYDWMNQVGPDAWTQTYGLSMDGTSKSTGILNLETMEFQVVI